MKLNKLNQKKGDKRRTCQWRSQGSCCRSNTFFHHVGAFQGSITIHSHPVWMDLVRIEWRQDEGRMSMNQSLKRMVKRFENKISCFWNHTYQQVSSPFILLKSQKTKNYEKGQEKVGVLTLLLPRCNRQYVAEIRYIQTGDRGDQKNRLTKASQSL